MAKEKNPRLASRRGYCLYIHSRRKRLADSDGISPKAVIDGMVYGGILADDKAEIIKEIRHTQTKSKEEETLIRVYEMV